MGGVKRSGRDGQVSQSQKRTHQEKRERCLAVCTNVQNALRQRRLLFAFQPVVCATTGEVDYFECLLRMRDVEGSIVTGRHFITSIEQLGLIGFIDDYVLEQTLQELANHPEVKLGLNVSSLTACDGGWLQLLNSLLAGRSDLARRLVVEITETAALADIAASAHFVDRLRETGCRVALDDYGAGHTSPRQLQIMAVDTVKVDGSYIQNLAGSREKQFLLRDMLGSINAFGCATVAEGVENADDAAAARAAGVGYLQGYHVARPTIERTWLGRARAATGRQG
jgi:EAL domain-containing protein (putative c-di-GMP-specific phosphodiesterase class I)